MPLIVRQAVFPMPSILSGRMQKKAGKTAVVRDRIDAHHRRFAQSIAAELKPNIALMAHALPRAALGVLVRKLAQLQNLSESDLTVTQDYHASQPCS